MKFMKKVYHYIRYHILPKEKIYDSHINRYLPINIMDCDYSFYVVKYSKESDSYTMIVTDNRSNLQ